VIPFSSFAVVDTGGRVLRTGRCETTLVPLQATAGEIVHELTEAEAALGLSSDWVRSSGEEWTLAPQEPPLEPLRAFLEVQVDREAEAARLRFITAGAGQALEYQATEAQARAWLAAVDPVLADYPFLQAEVQAIAAVTGFAPPVSAVATEVVAQADAWQAVGSEIKRRRRAAKMAIAAATTVAEAQAAASVNWPTP